MQRSKNFEGTHYFEKFVLISESQNAEFYRKSKSYSHDVTRLKQNYICTIWVKNFQN